MRQMFFNYLLKFSFLDYFPNEIYSSISKNNDQFPITSNNYHLIHCFYNFFRPNSNGCIYISTSNKVLLLIEYSSFLNCYSTTPGSGIFYSSNLGECIIKNICGNNCTSIGTSLDEGGMFCRVIISSGFRCFIIDSSISNCIKNTQYHTISIANGYQLVKSLNSSNNAAAFGTSIYCSGFNLNNMTLCTYIKNIGASTLAFRFGNGISYLNYSNIINNSSPSWAVNYNGAANTRINYCFFKDNDNYLFTVVTSGSCLISFSSIYHSINLKSGNVIISDEIYLINSYLLNHFSTYFCIQNIIILKSPKSKNIFYFIFKILFFNLLY